MTLLGMESAAADLFCTLGRLKSPRLPNRPTEFAHSLTHSFIDWGASSPPLQVQLPSDLGTEFHTWRTVQESPNRNRGSFPADAEGLGKHGMISRRVATGKEGGGRLDESGSVVQEKDPFF